MSTIGKGLVPVRIDEIAKYEPERPWGSMARHGTHDFYDISFHVFANAINRTAWWLIENVGRPKYDKIPTIAYIGPSDLRYYVLLVAIIKAGYKPLFLSHRNSRAANAALFESTECKILLCGFVSLDEVDAIDQQALTTFYIPASEALWAEKVVDPFPFEKTFEEAVNDPFVILHTSGSSGLPKPIIYTHGTLAIVDLRQNVGSPPGSLTEIAFRSKFKRALIGFPPFHGAGLLVGLQDSIWFNLVIVFPPSDRALDGAVFCDILEESRAQGAYLLPHVLEQIGHMPDTLAKIEQRLEYLTWVGGPISDATGEAISRVTTLLQAYATTEIGSPITLTTKKPEDWNYHWFAPGTNGFDFRPVQGNPDLYELFVVRDDEHTLQVFSIFPRILEWPTHDLFSMHSDHPELWRHEGRSDDLIVMGNGGKVNPRPIEVCIRGHTLVKEVMVVGHMRPRASVIIEPTDQSETANVIDKESFVDAVWPAVQGSNTIASTNGQILRQLVLPTDPSKPFPRTGKGTIQRRAAMELYKGELESAYSALPGQLRKPVGERIGFS